MAEFGDRMNHPGSRGVTATTGIRAPLPADRDAVLRTVRAAELLPDAGVLEVAADLDAALAGHPGAGAWLVDIAADEVAGVAYYAPERMADGAWNLLMLVVHPAHQRRGRGRALVDAVEQDLLGRAARLLIIETSGTPDFAAQRRFYADLRYTEQGWIENFFAPGDAKVVFAKALHVEDPRAGHRPGSSRPPVRVAATDDLPRLVALAEAFYAEDGFTTPREQLAANLRALLASDAAHVIVATGPAPASIAVAFAVTTTGFGLENGLIAELEDLYVHPDHRRTGLGALLIDNAVVWSEQRGCSHLEVVIAANGRDVDHLHRYYDAHGFADQHRRIRSRRLRS